MMSVLLLVKNFIEVPNDQAFSLTIAETDLKKEPKFYYN